MRPTILVLIIVIVIAALIGLFRWNTASDEPTYANADSAVLVALGEDLYKEQCAACHGKNLEGQRNWRQRKPDGRLPAPPHNDSGHTWHHSDQQLFQITKHGTASIAGPDYKTDMAAFGEILSDSEIWAVLAYIKSRWPEPIRRRSAEINAQTR